MKSVLDPIIAFYLDSAVIEKQIGFTFRDFMNFDDDTIESCHNFIQWVFPLKEASQFNPDAPLVTAITKEQFDEFYIIHNRMHEAFFKMHKFYFTDGRGFDSWVTPNNHNFLRITRIIKSQKIFGLLHNATVLWHNVNQLAESEDYGKIIGPTTQNFWNDAYQN